MKESRKKAKDGLDTDAMKEMRERYERAVDSERENRELALEDYRFVAIPGNQWDEKQRKARRGRPCYEIPVLRSNWRQVVNDQKKSRPGIKVRPVEDGDTEGAELRQGILRNIESRSNAERAYDAAFELLTATGFGAWRVGTEYSTDDAWDQDLVIRPIVDPLSSVWIDPDATDNTGKDAAWGFIEETYSRAKFKERFPKADPVDFESTFAKAHTSWFGQDSMRVVEYFRRIPVTKSLVLLSDGRTLDAKDITPDMAQQLMGEGVTVIRERECKTHKVVSSLCSGAEELDGPHDLVFDRIPIITAYANRCFVDGRWQWQGMVRSARDPQKLANYNITTGQESLAKQHKAVPIVTPKMLEGEGVKAMWDRSNAVDVPYLPITPDPMMPGGPNFLSPPPIHAAFVQMGQMSIDLVKMATGIYDASLGARSNETSGKAIMARQSEGDTATFDYQDALTYSVQATGEILLSALPKVYDTPRAMRVIGKDGGEKMVKLYEEGPDGSKANDLSAGKYDLTISVGPNYDTQRMEFVDALVQLGQGNPMVAQATADLVMKASDFPGAEEASERLKMLLPPPIQQMLSQGKELPPEAMMAMQQAEQAMQQAQQMGQEIQQAGMEIEQERAKLEAERAGVESDRAGVDAQRDQIKADIALANARLEVKQAKFEAAVARAEVQLMAKAQQQGSPEPA